jgi:ribosomal protein S18 acetylase RimI-like enzyme
MEVRSLGYRTDLMVRACTGSVVQDRGGHIVVRTPANPAFWWGNCVVVAGPAGPGDPTAWRALFRAEFPDVTHCAIGVDSVDGQSGPPAELEELELVARVSTVLSARALSDPAHRAPDEVTIRALESDEDWLAALDLRLVISREGGNRSPGHLEFEERSMRLIRGMAQAGDAQWFGAFAHARMWSVLGIVSDGRGLARYQAVETHPEHRRQGLAGALIHAAGLRALAHMAAHTLVIVADPAGPAIGLYRSLGFVEAESQVELNGRWMVPA